MTELYKKISSNISGNIRRIFRNSRVRYGVPFLLFAVLGSFGLKEFTAIRYKYRDVIPVYEEAKKAGVEMKKSGEVTLESVYDTIKELDIDHWENKRGPRPWEENESSIQK